MTSGTWRFFADRDYVGAFFDAGTNTYLDDLNIDMPGFNDAISSFQLISF